MQPANDQSLPSTPDELRAHGWRLVEAAIAGADSPGALIVHWFATPEDTSVHTDEHFTDDARTLKFVGLVVPTLADQLDASMLAVAVPWNHRTGDGLIVLLTAYRGAPVAVEARGLRRATERTSAPWWNLGTDPREPPPQLRELAQLLRI